MEECRSGGDGDGDVDGGDGEKYRRSMIVILLD